MMHKSTADALGSTILAYWDERARTYSNGVRGELSDGRHCAWQRALGRAASGSIVAASMERRTARALDLGCGPGFFTVLLAEEGCEVDAVDMSSEMLDRARANAAAEVPEARVSFHQCDASNLPFQDESFDIVVSRNLTWLMRDPEGAYADWLRVLRPGGKLVVFDANWYRYLIDEQVDSARRSDQERTMLECYDADSVATNAQELRCEKIALELPLTSIMRPQWDVAVLERFGASWVSADEDVWMDIWTESEQAFYASSPLFMIEALK